MTSPRTQRVGHFVLVQEPRKDPVYVSCRNVDQCLRVVGEESKKKRVGTRITMLKQGSGQKIPELLAIWHVQKSGTRRYTPNASVESRDRIKWIPAKSHRPSRSGQRGDSSYLGHYDVEDPFGGLWGAEYIIDIPGKGGRRSVVARTHGQSYRRIGSATSVPAAKEIAEADAFELAKDIEPLLVMTEEDYHPYNYDDEYEPNESEPSVVDLSGLRRGDRVFVHVVEVAAAQDAGARRGVFAGVVRRKEKTPCGWQVDVDTIDRRKTTLMRNIGHATPVGYDLLVDAVPASRGYYQFTVAKIDVGEYEP